MSNTPSSKNAIYLPAVSEAYARHDPTKPFARPCPIQPRDLDFCDPENSLFHYPYGLYSAGQAAKSANSITRKNLLSHRDRSRTVLLADSGGYQIQTGTIPFKGAETTLRMLRWMEQNGDYSMALDFPTGGISRGEMSKHRKRLEDEGHDLSGMNASNGLGLDYNASLKQTCINNNLMVQERVPGATKLLNVLQGRNEAESSHWYETVKHYPFEGWSLAGSHQTSFAMTLNRIFDMADDGLLQKAQWLHVLGISKLWAAGVLSVLQRCIRDRFNPTLQLSFDSSGPFLSASQNVIFTGYVMDRRGWNFTQVNVRDATKPELSMTLNEWAGKQRAPKDAAEFVLHGHGLWGRPGQRAWSPVATALGATVTVGDLAGQNSTGNLDEAGVRLLMNHNLQVFLEGIDAANDMFMFNALDFIPTDYFKLKVLIEKAFQQDDPRPFLVQAGPHLDALAHI
ncbi:hypothetical protein [Aurantimonas coralicida]|uniref:hypothetical protein n=1 Tax=Aurantimonas coralicida TaxID=182270 RepID=UPI001D18AA75|nr:hypothetical protein [Aurantimonas coralicida]MCC4298328.1 hypothetical protein [Aurantimonas coralicida]